MTQDIEKNVKNVDDTLKIGVYVVYDTVLKQYELPLSVPIAKLNDYFTIIINDVNSKYWNHESDYILNKIGDFNTQTGEIEQHFVERVCMLDNFINTQKRKLQTIVQTLNFLPHGYFKMSEEQKKDIQERIDKSIAYYVENYVIPDMDISSEKVRLLEEELNDYKERLKVTSNN